MKRRGDALAAAAFLAPFLILFTTFTVAPVLYGFWISLHKWHVLSTDTPFVGFRNYQWALGDDLLRIAFARTAYFVLLTVPIGNLVSLLFAVGLNQRFRGDSIYKVALYLPVLTSVSALAVLWRWLFNADVGLLNRYLGANFPWLGDPRWVMPSLALMSIWWGAGGNMLIYLAALKAVPRELLEAASLDGTTAWRRFWAITIPSIRPAVLFCLVLSVIASSQVFGQSYILTQGGPAYASLTVVLYMYQQGFGQYQLGYSSAVAYLLFLVVFAFTLIQFRVMRRSLQGD